MDKREISDEEKQEFIEYMLDNEELEKAARKWKESSASGQDKRMNVYSLSYTLLSSLTDLISVPNTFWHSY